MVRRKLDGTGDQWIQGGMRYTVNSTSDPRAPGGYYLSMTDLATGAKATAVYDATGDLVRFPGNGPKTKAPVTGARTLDSAARTQLMTGAAELRRQSAGLERLAADRTVGAMALLSKADSLARTQAGLRGQLAAISVHGSTAKARSAARSLEAAEVATRAARAAAEESLKFNRYTAEVAARTARESAEAAARSARSAAEVAARASREAAESAARAARAAAEAAAKAARAAAEVAAKAARAAAETATRLARAAAEMSAKAAAATAKAVAATAAAVAEAVIGD